MGLVSALSVMSVGFVLKIYHTVVRIYNVWSVLSVMTVVIVPIVSV